MLHRRRFLSINFPILSSCKKFSLRQIRLKTGLFNHDGDDIQEGYVRFYKSRGQHILTNQRVLDSIVRSSDIKATDTVLEIGPGTGNLTLKLLDVAEKVVAIEIDSRMVEILNKRVASHGLQDRLTVIHKDALKTEFPQFDLAVANIPYGISSPLVAKLIFGQSHFRSATLLLQKEFARRLLAQPGDCDFNRLAVNVKLVSEVQFVMDVSKRDFVPCPKVDSSVLRMHRKAEIPNVSLDEWWAFTRTCFGKKNKTLGATFKQKKKVIELFKTSESTTAGSTEESNRSEEEMGKFREKLVGILRCNGFEERRPSKLSHEELLHLLYLFNNAGIYFYDQRKLKEDDEASFIASFTPL